MSKTNDEMKRISSAWLTLSASLWFVPALTVVLMVALAVALIELDGFLPADTLARFPRLFGAGAEGTRGMLSAIASSMITVAGVVFSITIVALSLTSSQYSPRVLRNFMRDRSNQLVLGVFVGIYAYCLVVLRTIRGGDEAPFVPSLASLGAIVLAFVGVALLIHFIHHISSAIQAAHILKAIREDVALTIDRVFPEEIGDDDEEHVSRTVAAVTDRGWRTVLADKTGYIQAIDWNTLIRIACKSGTTVHVRCAMGEFITAGMPLLAVAHAEREDLPEARMRAAISIGDQRTTEEDPEFGVRQMVDIALKALSPAVNDPTTAMMCLDNLGALMVQLVGRRFPASLRYAEGHLRVIATAPTFEWLLGRAMDDIRSAAASESAVLTHMTKVLTMLTNASRSKSRRVAVIEQIRNIQQAAAQIRDPRARERIRQEVVAALAGLDLPQA